MDTVRRSRTPSVVLTANGEVHTHEEAQVFVHDLNLFVTVRLLEETPAVLWLGKLCEDHGHSNEWVSGQKPRLTPYGKSIICKTDNFVPLVVAVLCANSGSRLRPQHRHLRREEKQNKPLETELLRVHLQVQYLSEVTNKVHLKLPNQNTKRDDTKNEDDPLADTPEWLTESKENLVE